MSGRTSRRGHVAIVFLVVLPVLLLVLLMVLHTTQLEQARSEVQQAADAAALAAGLALVDDASLQEVGVAGPRAEPPMLAVLHRAQEEAVLYARRNTVLGSPSTLLLAADNAEEGDVLFGLADSSETAPLRIDLHDRGLLPLINTVRVNVVRSAQRNNAVKLIGGASFNGRAGEMTRSATAFLDRAVLGFRPVVEKPLPLVPLALLSDPTSRDSWESQVETGENREDRWRYVKEPYRVMNDRGDGLYEMTVRLSGARDGSATNCRVVYLGTSAGPEVARQVREGVHRDDLEGLNGELVLGPGNRLVVPGTNAGPLANSLVLGDLALALKELSLTGEIRAWPLFDPQFQEELVLKGWVAARVMDVRRPNGTGAGEMGAGLRVVLQPACLHSASVVTAPPEAAENWPRNRYLCKVRLAR